MTEHSSQEIKERSVDRLSRYLIYLGGAAAIIAICWYFRSVLVYIIAAAVVSLLGRPIKSALQAIKIKGKSAPSWLLSVFTLLIIIFILTGIVTEVIPIMLNIGQTVVGNLRTEGYAPTDFTATLQQWSLSLSEAFPTLGKDFSLKDSLASILADTFSVSRLTSIIKGIASSIGSLAIGLFSIVFISFFFIKDENLFRRIVAALVPDRLEEKSMTAIGEVEHLLSRYFIGLLLEVIGVAVLNFIGLTLVCSLSASAAIGIAFIAGILNVIPYIGPWIGAAIGTVLGTVLKYSAAVSVGASINLPVTLLLLVAVFVVTQLVDNFLFQPFIYSTSIKSSPLEIFIVMLIAGQTGGIPGMIAAIPAYTVIRVIAAEFFYDIKAIRRLIPNREATSSTSTSLPSPMRRLRKSSKVKEEPRKDGSDKTE